MKLDNARNKIDRIDERIAELFAERQKLSGEIAKIKKEKYGLNVEDL